MNKDIRDYVKTCLTCQQVKSIRRKPFGMLEPCQPASKVFETILCDFMGPFPASGKGRQNKYLLVVVDEDDNHGTWDKHLQKFTFALRVNVNETTKVSPALLNLGRELPLPFEREISHLEENQDLERLREERKEIPRKLELVIAWVRENIVKAKEKHKKQYDKYRTDHPFKEGQTVWIKMHARSDKEKRVMLKLVKRWRGPYQLGKAITPVTFEVLRIPGLEPIGKRHVE